MPFDLEPASFPPPPLRTSPHPAPAAPPAVFHATAAPMAPPPPSARAGRPSAQAAAAAPSSPAPAASAAPPHEVSPESPTAHLPRAGWPVAPAPAVSPEQLELLAGLPDLAPPELPELDLAELTGLGDHAELGGPGEPAEAGHLLPAVDEPWATAPAGAAAPPSRAARVPAGLTEVARAFAPGAQAPPSAPSPVPPQRSIESDETVRMARFAPPAAGAHPAAGAAPAASSLGEWLSPAAPPAVAGAAPPSPDRGPAPAGTFARRAARPERRRSRWPLGAVLALLLLAGGAAVLLTLRFPELLPAWAPGAPPPAPSAEAPARFVQPRRATPAELAARGAAPGAEPAAATEGGVPPALPAPGATRLPGAAAPRGPAAAAPEADAAPAARFSTLEEIWGQRNAAGTMVTLVADGAIPDGSFTHSRLDGGRPREVVYLRGVAAKFPRPSVPVGTPEVAQVRTGFHVKPAGNELHVVVDLASPRVRLLRAVAVDNRIELLFASQ